MKKLTLALVGLFIVLFLPYWAVMSFVLAMVVYFREYALGVGLAFLFDVLYFGGVLHHATPLLLMVPQSVYALALALCVSFARRHLRQDPL